MMNLIQPHETAAPDEWLIERMRAHRNALLIASDWTMVTDAPTNKTAWQNYRQALRDFPATWTPDIVVNFPHPPSE